MSSDRLAFGVPAAIFSGDCPLTSLLCRLNAANEGINSLNTDRNRHSFQKIKRIRPRTPFWRPGLGLVQTNRFDRVGQLFIPVHFSGTVAATEDS